MRARNLVLSSDCKKMFSHVSIVLRRSLLPLGDTFRVCRLREAFEVEPAPLPLLSDAIGVTSSENV